jgi:pimeloyl-ACP methyl ester carboxylesterase
MGVPDGFPRDEAQTRAVADLLDSIFPMRPRAAGGTFDAYVSNPSVNDLPLENLTAPTLLIHAIDDPLCASRPPNRRRVASPAACSLRWSREATSASARRSGPARNSTRS